MDNLAERVSKLREERLAREKARIEKLRELNLKKYSNQNTTKNLPDVSRGPTNPAKNNLSAVKNRVSTAPAPRTNPLKTIKSTDNKVEKKPFNKNIGVTEKQNTKPTTSNLPKQQPKPTSRVSIIDRIPKSAPKPRICIFERNKHTVPAKVPAKPTATTKPVPIPRMSTVKPTPTSKLPARKSSATSNISVFERLYKPKMVNTSHTTTVEKLQNDPAYLQKVINQTGLILNRRHTIVNPKMETEKPDPKVRRSISAVHLKRVSRSELPNCIHKWASIGEKLNNIDLKQVNEDETVNDEKVISAIKSERKRVTFMTPAMNFNTPKQEELQARLKAWLQKRGKSLDSYHHLQCFGLHHLPHSLKFDPKLYEDEDKENICVESDSDDDSYTENMNGLDDKNNKWRAASIVSDSVDLNETQVTTTTCSEGVNTNEVVIGALSDLTELLKEGFDWMQCARWLRAIRERFPSSVNSAAYWECRAALEDRRGDLPASVKCWEEAIIQGSEHSVAEANLDQLLDKFMQLQISPNSGVSKPVEAKFVDVKNVFKSSIIRFAVQQAKLREINQNSTPVGTPRYSMTPVRRSARLTTNRTPLQICTSVSQAPQNATFVPNKHLICSP